MKAISILCIGLLSVYFFPGSCYAQEEVGPLEENFPDPPPPFPGKTEIENVRPWEWKCLGPDTQPVELNPGGKAIPAYAVSRGNGTGRINYLLISPRNDKHLWACSPTGGMWYTRDEGEHWLEAGTDQLPISGISSVAVNSKNNKQWIVATGDGDDLFMFTDGIWRTRNRGKSWVNINGQDPAARLPFLSRGDIYSFICEVVANPDNFNNVFVASNSGLFVTDNACDKPSKVKWRKISDGYFYDIEMIKENKNLIVAAAGDRLLVSRDGGKLFEEMPKPLYDSPDKYPFLRISIEHSAQLPYVLLCAVTCSQAASMSAIGEARLQEFNILTREWKNIRSLKADGMNNMIPTRARAFAVSPVDAENILCANVQPIYYSHDGGLVFNKIESRQMHDDVHHIAFSSDGTTAWAAHDGGVSMSRDGGLHWQSRDNGIGAANVFGISTAQSQKDQLLYGGYDTGGNLLRDGQWYHVTWGDGFECITDRTNPDVMISSKQNGSLNKSVDGKSFDRVISPPSSGTEWHTWIRQNRADPKTIYCSGSRLSRSNDLGETWQTILDAKKLDNSLYNAYRFFLSDDHPSVMYVYLLDETKVHPQVWRSFNINASEPTDVRWEKVKEIPHEGWIVGIQIDPDDPNRFWMLYNMYEPAGKIFYFDGTDYLDYTANLGSCKTESIILQRGNERRLYVGSNYGIFTRTPREDSWTLLTGLPGTFIKSLAINDKKGQLIVGTFGRGVWVADLYGN